ncbi:multiheme c-type cytochrome [Methanococcoides sp. AM1]|uniref:multiheme c-type cytochrome n=1 Tax=Methanococcoides sp. AM1 TaxID=1201011 RepID=UPI00108444F6|nr:multiheme c-type cytochrome [Methanococcoides sp. AM1]
MKLKGHNRLLSVIIISFTIVIILSIAVTAQTYVIGDQKTAVVMPVEGATYIGADECKVCHQDIYGEWETSGHKYKLMTPDEALEIRPDLPMPEGYTKNDVLYVIGGWGWKARYMNNQGFIITKTGDDLEINGSNQYNIETDEWVDYHAGELLEYDCQKCHTTGVSYDEKMEDLLGINGSWEFRGIQCEACHGAGSEHVAEKGIRGVSIIVNESASFCGQCHRRGAEDDKIPASGTFVRHHEQYQELLASGNMSTLSCVVCHNPHNPVHEGATNEIEEFGIITHCEDCHIEAAEIYENSVMGVVGAECVDCHMPKNVKSAVNTSPYVADVSSHIFRINTSVDAEFIYIDQEDGNEYANPYITLEYACLSCHEDEDISWAAQTTPFVINHNVEHEDIQIPTTPEETPGFGVITAVAVLIIGCMFRRI